MNIMRKVERMRYPMSIEKPRFEVELTVAVSSEVLKRDSYVRLSPEDEKAVVRSEGVIKARFTCKCSPVSAIPHVATSPLI